MSKRRDTLPGYKGFFPVLWYILMFTLFPQFVCPLNTSDIVGDTFEEVDGTGLVIRTKPAGVRVFIDGVEKGQTPFTHTTIRRGSYNIRLIKDGYKERMFSVTVSGKSRLNVSIEMEELKGKVLVNVYRAEESPPELSLKPLIDGGRGESSETILELPVGLRNIRVRAFGWEEVTETVHVSENLPVTIHVTLKPAPFNISAGKISRRNFNPFNPGGLGETDFYYSVTGPGAGTMVVQDQYGTEVYSASVGTFDTWLHKASWNGRDISGAALPEGGYKISINAESFSEDSENAVREVSLYTNIDYTLVIYPLSFAGGIPGLLFTPIPAALPAGSFQVNALYLLGNFSVPEKTAAAQDDNTFLFFPVEFGFRFSLLNRLELGGTFNVNTASDVHSGYGFSFSAKYAFLSGAGSFPLGLALGLSYTYANENGELPLDTGRGVGVYLPMSLSWGPVKALFSPGMSWPGPGDPIPRLLLSAGAMYLGSRYSVGLSVREDFDFTNSGERRGISFSQRLRFHGGLEINFYPPPSYLVYTILGGFWLHGDRIGGFGGLGIGFIY